LEARRTAALISAAAALAFPAIASAHAGHAHPQTHGPDPATPGLKARASADAAPWCGAAQAADETRNELSNGDYRYHAVYLVAADAPDRFASLAPQIQSGAFRATELLERLYDRAIRFDMGTSCGSQFLDISVVRSALTTADFARASSRANGTLTAVASSLAAAGFPTLSTGDSDSKARRLKRNWIVWLDAPAPKRSCGEAQVYDDPARSQSNWNNYGGKLGVVFRSRAGFCGPAAVRHEIGHTLGAMQSSAPNAFDGMHCDDAYEDTMCYPHAEKRGGGAFENEFFDYGNDDYWDPPKGKPLGWWTANLNRFVCQSASCNTVAVAAKRKRR
jgi:hypothetical protein